MPSPSSDLNAANVAFDKAREALSAAQLAVRDSKTASTLAALAKAQEVYKEAGQAARRAADPDRALDILEFKRHLTEKAKLVAAKRNRQVMS